MQNPFQEQLNNPIERSVRPTTTCNSERAPSHPLSHSVQLIKDFVGFEDKSKWGWGYWTGLVGKYAKRKKMDKDNVELFFAIERIIKDLQDLPDKYGRGQTLTNKLK